MGGAKMLNQELENGQKSELLQSDNVEVKVRFTYIEAIRETDAKSANLEYPVDMNLGEAVRKLDGTAVIGFSLRVATQPKIAVFAVKGEATISGPREKVQKATIPENNSPPLIWRSIYQESISAVTFLARFLGVPSPPLVSNL
jgi:hypothetical protein